MSANPVPLPTRITARVFPHLARSLVLVPVLICALLGGLVAQAADAPMRRVVFGSYADPATAEEKAEEVRAALGIEVQMVPVDQDGIVLTRVTSMPLAGDEVWPLTSKAASARLEYWTWRLPE